MKVLITTDWYKPVINGVVTSVDNLRAGLEKQGHDVRILTLSKSIHPKKHDNVYYIGSVGVGMIYPNARLKLKADRDFMWEIMVWKPDVVHSQCEFSTFPLAKKIAEECHAPLIHTYHTVYEDYTHYFCPSKAMGRGVTRFLSRKILSDTQAVIAPSTKIQDLLLGYHIQEPIYVVPSGICMEKFSTDKHTIRESIRANYGIREDECIMLYLGRLAKEKNMEELLYFLKEYPDKTQRMLIVGDGPYREELDALVRKLKLENQIIFTGMVTPDQVADYYAAGDIFVSASSSETQGLTYMEAMASGLPVLCREDACLKDVIHSGENGFTYRTEKEFRTLLTRLLTDPQLRNSIGSAARKSVMEQFSVQTFCNSCTKIYQEHIRRKGA